MIVLHSLGCSRRFAQSPKNNEEITLSLTYMAKGDRDCMTYVTKYNRIQSDMVTQAQVQNG